MKYLAYLKSELLSQICATSFDLFHDYTQLERDWPSVNAFILEDFRDY